MTTHIRRRGELNWRFDANGMHAVLRQRLATWAADPRTTIPQLRRALDEAIMSRPKPEWDAFSLQREYLELNRRLEQNGLDNVPSWAELFDRLAGFEIPNNLAECLYAGQRFPQARARTQPAGPPAGLCELACARRDPRVQATTPSRPGDIVHQDDPRVFCSIPSVPWRRLATGRYLRTRSQAGSSRPKTPRNSYTLAIGHTCSMRKSRDIMIWSFH